MPIELWLAFVAASAVLLIIPISGGALLSVAGVWALLAKRPA
ncbi:MAG: hypothetical protein V4787_27270 [Pseudomonadota bacterium]